MNKIKTLTILILIPFLNQSFGQESPQDLTIIEDSLSVIEETIPIVKEDNNRDNLNSYETEIKKIDQENYNEIIIDDIPEEPNDWHGLLASEDGGLGWLMWGSTDYKYALGLIKKSDLIINSPTLLQLYLNALLSRAKSPSKIENITKFKSGQNKKQETNNSDLSFFYEKVRILSALGLSTYIQTLSSSIPLELKQVNFEGKVKRIRYENLDFPFICNNVKKNLYEIKEKHFNRKVLIACKIARNQLDQAMLALDLLENDLEDSDDFIKFAREFIDNDVFDLNLTVSNDKKSNVLYSIIGMKNFDIANEIFLEKKISLEKIIYDMKLYSRERQTEALERLVSAGIYGSNLLSMQYLSFLEDKKASSNIETLDIKINSVATRAKLYQLAAQSDNLLDRSKYLNNLWKKADYADVYRGVSLATKKIALTIKPDEKFIWLLYPMVKSLLISDEVEEAKNWLFLISENFNKRAALDPNFSKILLMLYIKDKNFLKENPNLPPTEYLIEVLLNDLELDQKMLLNTVLTLKALKYKVPNGIWKKFEGVSDREKNNIIQQFNLNESIVSNNRAEAVFQILYLLSNKKIKEDNNYSGIYNSIKSLYDLGLENYARNFAFEVNLRLIN